MIKMDQIISILATILVVAKGTQHTTYECDPYATVCETSINIGHAMTMMHLTEKATFTHNGKLYRYDVINITAATPIPDDDVITVTDGRNREF